MLYSVVTCANMRGVRAVDRIAGLCQRDLAFIWLTKGQKPQRDVFYDFKGKKLTGKVLDELNYQFLRRLKNEGLITFKKPCIDGTKQNPMQTAIPLSGAGLSATILSVFWIPYLRPNTAGILPKINFCRV